MPKLFCYNELSAGSATVKAYADKHTPVITCEPTAIRNKKFKVNVRVGISLAHPNTKEHYFAYIQLWNLETLVAEATFTQGCFGKAPMQVEVDFYVVPAISTRLQALAYCTKHGLWKSEEVFVKVVDE